MTFTANTAPIYPIGPISNKVAVPAAAKTTFTDITNAALLVPSMANNRQSFGLIYAQSSITVVAGKLMLFIYDGSTAYAIDEIAFSAGTITTTANPVGKISFTQWSSSSPLIIPEGHSLYVANSVAQTANSLIAHAQLGKIF